MEIMRTRTMQPGIMAAILVILCCLVGQNVAQVQQQQCINTLQPCMNYLNSNQNPPDSCCRPLDYVIRSMPECLCSFMTIQGANQAEQAGINVTQAQTLPGRCGQHINPLGCVTGTPDTRSRNSVQNSGTSFFNPSSLNIAAVASIIAIFLAL